jgi:hypothetical protein
VKSIKNVTRTFLRITLPGGKVLRLGPGNTGQIAETASEHPSVKKLLDAGKIQIVGEGTHHPTESIVPGGTAAGSSGHLPRNKGTHGGDR